jgi:ribosomal protein S27AE
MNDTGVKLQRGQKRCPNCGAVVAARLAQCECGHVFYQKKQKTKKNVVNEDAPSVVLTGEN